MCPTRVYKYKHPVITTLLFVPFLTAKEEHGVLKDLTSELKLRKAKSQQKHGKNTPSTIRT